MLFTLMGRSGNSDRYEDFPLDFALLEEGAVSWGGDRTRSEEKH